jgi:hypothetical protein
MSHADSSEMLSETKGKELNRADSNSNYFETISLFFHLRTLRPHFRHRVALEEFLAVQTLQILKYRRRFWARLFFTGSAIGKGIISTMVCLYDSEQIRTSSTS